MGGLITEDLHQVQWILTRIQRRSKKVHKDKWQEWKEATEKELNESYEKRNNKNVWKLAYAYAGTAPKRKYRRFDFVSTQATAIAEWVRECEKPGEEGGVRGKRIDYEQ